MKSQSSLTRGTQKSGKTEKTNYKLTQQTLLTNNNNNNNNNSDNF